MGNIKKIGFSSVNLQIHTGTSDFFWGGGILPKIGGGNLPNDPFLIYYCKNLVPLPPQNIGKAMRICKFTLENPIFLIFPIFAQNWLNLVFDPENPGFMGVWVLGLGVRVRMEGVLY